MDICEVVWGSSIFYALYDEPDLVQAMLEVVTETYIAFMRAWLEIVSFRQGANVHWGLHQGQEIDPYISRVSAPDEPDHLGTLGCPVRAESDGLQDRCRLLVAQDVPGRDRLAQGQRG